MDVRVKVVALAVLACVLVTCCALIAPAAIAQELPRHPPRLHSYQLAERRWEALAVFERAPAGTRWHALRVDGVRRRYLLSVPPGPRRERPLVIAFHGLGQHAAGFARQTQLVSATRAAGEVLALPESLGPAFNDGRLGPRGPADDAFTLDIVRTLTAAGVVAPSRVTVTGFSNGAGMAMQIADTQPAAVAAVVSIAGDMIHAPWAARPTAPVPAVLVHGTADRVQPWRGRRSRGITWPAYISIPDTVGEWARANRADVTSRSVIHRRSDGRGHRVVVATYTSASAGAPVTFYAVIGMGHRWPVTGPTLGRRGVQAEAISATSIVVRTAAHAAVRRPAVSSPAASEGA